MDMQLAESLVLIGAKDVHFQRRADPAYACNPCNSMTDSALYCRRRTLLHQSQPSKGSSPYKVQLQDLGLLSRYSGQDEKESRPSLNELLTVWRARLQTVSSDASGTVQAQPSLLSMV
ncbi:unnamed protein product [Pleuronectes platessa]|uniref:Uncharacterized protein n=1 Tax=Pleuronectes platessa TaxID=8262 RepID=A0A9N7VUD8_PLEPL|nr:unnamed protein product [Pleuronectes platessa]